MVPAVTLASTPGSRGKRNCLTKSLSPTLSVRQGVNPVPGPARHDQLTQMSFVVVESHYVFSSEFMLGQKYAELHRFTTLHRLVRTFVLALADFPKFHDKL